MVGGAIAAFSIAALPLHPGLDLDRGTENAHTPEVREALAAQRRQQRLALNATQIFTVNSSGSLRAQTQLRFARPRAIDAAPPPLLRAAASIGCVRRARLFIVCSFVNYRAVVSYRGTSSSGMGGCGRQRRWSLSCLPPPLPQTVTVCNEVQ